MLGCYGIKFKISGKISVSGNAKTRTYGIHHGFDSLTTKSYRLDKSISIVRTLTGAMGMHLYIYF